MSEHIEGPEGSLLPEAEKIENKGKFREMWRRKKEGLPRGGKRGGPVTCAGGDECGCL